MKDDRRIRLVTPDDAAAVARIYRPIVESTAISFETVVPSDAEMRQRIADKRGEYPWLVLEAAGAVAGYAYGSRHRPRAAYRWSVETSVYVAADCRERGVGRSLYSALFSILSEQGFANAYAGIALPNAASVALHERMGFQPIGVFRRVGFKFGEWRDVGWWQKPIRDNATDLAPPKKLDEIREPAEWDELLERQDIPDVHHHRPGE